MVLCRMGMDHSTETQVGFFKLRGGGRKGKDGEVKDPKKMSKQVRRPGAPQ